MKIHVRLSSRCFTQRQVGRSVRSEDRKVQLLCFDVLYHTLNNQGNSCDQNNQIGCELVMWDDVLSTNMSVPPDFFRYLLRCTFGFRNSRCFKCDVALIYCKTHKHDVCPICHCSYDMKVETHLCSKERFQHHMFKTEMDSLHRTCYLFFRKGWSLVPTLDLSTSRTMIRKGIPEGISCRATCFCIFRTF